jgi:hypothetical protein
MISVYAKATIDQRLAGARLRRPSKRDIEDMAPA